MKPRYFISIIWGYSPTMYTFTPEEKYHLHVLKVAKELGYQPIIIIRQGPGNVETDPDFDPGIIVHQYQNFAHYLWLILKYNYQNAVFYVNSYEWRSFVVPFFVNRSIFMGHTHVIRQTRLKQLIQKFVFHFFSRIRLNNESEEKFLLQENLPKNKLFVVPLVVPSSTFYYDDQKQRQNLVYYGHVTKKKNLATILQALSLVREKFPDIKLDVIGKIHDEDFWPTVSRLGLEQHVIYRGFFSQTEAANLLNNYAIAVNSSFDEGQCVAVFDAALCGCALCLPAIMSFVDVFHNKALFHQKTNHAELAADIICYQENEVLRQNHNDDCRAMIKQMYNLET
ncbi:MAG: glycosyltransferase, partial [bacterium]